MERKRLQIHRPAQAGADHVSDLQVHRLVGWERGVGIDDPAGNEVSGFKKPYVPTHHAHPEVDVHDGGPERGLLRAAA